MLQVIQQSGENAKLKIRERELIADLDFMRARIVAYERGETPPTSPHNHMGNSTGVEGPLLNEPTEIEVR